MSFLSGFMTWTHDVLLPMGPLGLFILGVIESIFFPVPVDVLLIILAAANPAGWWWLGLLAMAGSVLGAVVGYWIGYVGEMVVLERLFKKKYIEKAHSLFNKYEFWAVFIAGFTPIPYKVFTLAAGAFYVRFWPFIAVSIMSRGLRFLLVAGAVAYVANLGIEFSLALINALSISIVLILIEAYLAKKIWFRQQSL